MKGIILAGGLGTRLMPLTKVTNKHLLPVYNKPMILYSINLLKKAGIKDAMIITSPEFFEHFEKLIGDGSNYGLSIKLAVQEEPSGIAHAINLARNFVDGNFVVLLGDNIYSDNFDFSNFVDGAKVFLKKVNKSYLYGIATLSDNAIVGIEEKPQASESMWAVTGLYLYDTSFFEKFDRLSKSQRGEYEITDINNMYLQENKLAFEKINGFWIDAGTFENLSFASDFVRDNQKFF